MTVLTAAEGVPIALIEIGIVAGGGVGGSNNVLFIKKGAITPGVYATRSSVTSDPARLVLWVGDTDPGRGAGFMLPGDIWFQQS